MFLISVSINLIRKSRSLDFEKACLPPSEEGERPKAPISRLREKGKPEEDLRTLGRARSKKEPTNSIKLKA